jgi:small subunit ribosomal protein S16
VKIDQEKAQKWLRDGAQPTETVARLLKQAQAEAAAAPAAPSEAE